ncbi:hypothetical protein [Micromonospora antibiotica]|uniref:Uncharacterized protein n=1 Tax=Micromonospora antibiotica TaxID=2807623 RepID=A0ABS3V7Z3_9ACTN|nr:hypothetical protein [Micromonospora antibiotica]MBO4161740.1 hypothetical protein [Micromonospora antibiotica]
MSRSVLPDVGNLAWAPITSLEEVEIFDRHNGVPTLGIFRTNGQNHLFWRVIGYTGDISLWLYVPLSPEEDVIVEEDEGPGILDGIIFRCKEPRYVAVGVADYHRIVFEREWNIPPGLSNTDLLQPLLEFVAEALQLAINQGLPASRRDLFQKAREAVRNLVSC